MRRTCASVTEIFRVFVGVFSKKEQILSKVSFSSKTQNIHFFVAFIQEPYHSLGRIARSGMFQGC